MSLSDSRRLREHRTIEAMMEIYCHDLHGTRDSKLCPDCQALFDYATVRLERCRFQGQKPTCAKCPVHCYSPQPREEVKTVMRYAGPRMIWRHPVLSIRHMIDGWKKAPDLVKRVTT